MHRRKGIALPLETVVLLILSAIVLGALLAFFLGFFNPAQTETQLTQRQFALCQEIAAAGCQNAQLETMRKLQDEKICTPVGQKDSRPTCSGGTPEECVRVCCRIFCG